MRFAFWFFILLMQTRIYFTNFLTILAFWSTEVLIDPETDDVIWCDSGLCLPVIPLTAGEITPIPL